MFRVQSIISNTNFEGTSKWMPHPCVSPELPLKRIFSSEEKGKKQKEKEKEEEKDKQTEREQKEDRKKKLKKKIKIRKG